MDTNELNMVNYLVSKVSDGTFLGASLIGVNGDANVGEFQAVVLRGTTSNIEYYNLSPDGVTYTYSRIYNKDTPETTTNNINLIKTTLIDSLPKNYTEGFKNKRRDDLIEIWKDLVLNSGFDIPTEIKEGIFLLEKEDAECTEQELVYKSATQDLINKIVARNRIESEVGDVHDLIADMSKRITFLERLLTRTAHQIMTGTPMAQEYIDSYLPLIEAYLGAVDSGQFVDRADLEDQGTLFTTIMTRLGAISGIVYDEYLSKKQ